MKMGMDLATANYFVKNNLDKIETICQGHRGRGGEDATSGTETYGGGRYMDLRIPKNDEIIIDFNKAYHPYCAYNAFDYNCPIVPEENWLKIPIEAGVKYEDIWFEH